MPDNVTFLFAAFAVAWLLIFGYLLFIGGRIGGLRGEVEALRDELDARTSRSATGEIPPHQEETREHSAELVEVQRHRGHTENAKRPS